MPFVKVLVGVDKKFPRESVAYNTSVLFREFGQDTHLVIGGDKVGGGKVLREERAVGVQ